MPLRLVADPAGPRNSVIANNRADRQQHAEAVRLMAARNRPKSECKIECPQQYAGGCRRDGEMWRYLAAQRRGDPEHERHCEIATAAPPGRRCGRVPVVAWVQAR